MANIFTPPAPAAPLPKEKIDPEYARLRRQVFIGIFVGYAGFYLIRKNFTLAMPFLEQSGFDKGELGLALSMLAYAYGISKFLMGSVSDRSNARVFLPFGLAMSALITAALGLCGWLTASMAAMSCALFACGWFQGMGWPPCGRIMVHWFSTNERGIKMSIWNVAHNLGGLLMPPLTMLGMWIFSGDWKLGIFVFPAAAAGLVAFSAWCAIRDTPKSCGLPPVEIYRSDSSHSYSSNDEKELSAKQIFFEHVFNNGTLWSIAVANAFVYFVRYGILDWAPTYFQTVKGFDFAKSGFAYFGFELAGIVGTVVCGWISDKIFGGRRSPVCAIFMILTAASIMVYWLAPQNSPLTSISALFAIGFLIYGPVMLIGLQALDIVTKKAAGTAAGFTGFFGYFVGTATFGNLGIGYIVEHLGWSWNFSLILGACAITIAIMLANTFAEYRRQ